MKHRHHLPQLDGGLFLTDGGIETTLIFQEGLDLPRFAAFDLLKDDEGTETLRRYFEPYAELARDHGPGFVLESPPGGRVPIGPRRSEDGRRLRVASPSVVDYANSGEVSRAIGPGCLGAEDRGLPLARQISKLSASSSASLNSRRCRSPISESGS